MSRNHRRQKHSGVETALANFALTFAKALLVFCVVLFCLISPESKKTDDGIKPKVEVMIDVEWDAGKNIDIDTWIKLPNDSVVYYNNKESGIVFLDRDDLGNNCISSCEEITSLRGLAPGEYIINLHLYGKDKDTQPKAIEPILARVKILQMNPVTKIIWASEHTFIEIRQELHVVRLKIDEEGNITFDNTLPTKIRTLPQ